MKIKITTDKKEIKSKNYNDVKETTFKSFIRFYIESLRISFPDIRKNEMDVIEFLINNDLNTDYFSSENCLILSERLKTSISNIKNYIKPNLIKKRLIVNINPNPEIYTRNTYLLSENIRNFINYIQTNKDNINNIEIKFDFKIIK
jgi:hypothetical protein